MERTQRLTTFRINTPRVVHQTMDNETVIIDFDNGAYFYTDGVGAEIWDQIAHNIPVVDIVHTLIRRYTGEITVIEKGVDQFLIELQNESLIVPIDGVMSAPDSAPVPGEVVPVDRLLFRPPSLNKYTDMQDLLLLDPIHEVDEQGWPIKKNAVSE